VCDACENGNHDDCYGSSQPERKDNQIVFGGKLCRCCGRGSYQMPKSGTIDFTLELGDNE
jgi:hypothetical protein